ncbi:ABC transporter substrate-binding protein [Isoptericola halotolerans]|uniref:Osmoprotectant transport system substrate-binding protein n=1 Tax=Isoptericola halotolerans TaxID=300560 RepID=A0ABX2A1D4_9MICO|nr:ABC transporter substrate-binding protein [Isoptericola halotolerans]NOV96672.1 osmoprotectant transport system substrate-binding protein [Isoptericola halotolerans]
MRTTRRTTALVAAAAATMLTLSACGGDTDPLAQGTGDDEPSAPDTIVVGSQAYYSNEIVAEIYAQALEADGFTVERNFSIGQRDAYMPALEDGEVQVFPEYTGNLLQFFDPETTATSSDDVYVALQEALPDSLAVLEQSTATDQDSYNVTADFAAAHDLVGIGDLADVDEEIVVGGPAELEERPYGPQGLADVYGVDVSFEATGDTTVQDLVAGTVNVANVFSADPRIQTEGLVTLEDTEGLFLASNVVPLVGAGVAEEVASALDPVSAALTPEGLVDLNVRSTEEQLSSSEIAADWLAENDLG